MSVKYRVQYKAEGWHTEYKCKAHSEAMITASDQARWCKILRHRVQAKVLGSKWKTIATLEPANDLREIERRAKYES